MDVQGKGNVKFPGQITTIRVKGEGGLKGREFSKSQLFDERLGPQLFEAVETSLSSAEKSLKSALNNEGSEQDVQKMQIDSKTASARVSFLKLDTLNLSKIEDHQLLSTVERLRDIKERIMNLQSESALPIMNLNDRSNNYEKIVSSQKTINAENLNALAQVEETLLFCRQELNFRQMDKFVNFLNNAPKMDQKSLETFSATLEKVAQILDEIEKVMISSSQLEIKESKKKEPNKFTLNKELQAAFEYGKKVETNILHLQSRLGTLMMNTNITETKGYKELEKDYGKSKELLNTIGLKLKNIEEQTTKISGEMKKSD